MVTLRMVRGDPVSVRVVLVVVVRMNTSAALLLAE
jgi:hypothetical protein